MKKFIRIQSTTNITVTPGLQALDVTNPDAHVPDRLKVQPAWPKAAVDIHAGVDIYPIEIKEWNTVKCLVRDKILTLGEELDDSTEEDNKKRDDLNTNLDEISSMDKKSRKKTESLSEIAGE